MSGCDCAVIAAVLRDANLGVLERTRLASAFATALATTNPTFDRATFLASTQPRRGRP